MKLIRNARIVTASEAFLGTLCLENGLFSGLSQSDTSVSAALDWEGDFLLPGLVELHTDNLEKHLIPRPKVQWPMMPAILGHDAQMVSAGITTVLDAIAVGDIDVDSIRMKSFPACLTGLQQASDAGLLRADHFLHLRLELAEQHLLTLFLPLLDDPRLKLVSLMDHTPGQRQWSNLSLYRTYLSGKRGWSIDKIDALFDSMIKRQQAYAASNRREIVARCNDRMSSCCSDRWVDYSAGHAADSHVAGSLSMRTTALALATHDDTTLEHVQQGIAEGIGISEFPTTMTAALAARQYGQKIIMGAPNLVRGGSHSGNVCAAELARVNLLDILSSDYVPASLLHAAFLLQDAGYSLPEAVATVTCNPAHTIGLHDRGEIACGLRADFIRVRLFDGLPVVRGVWKAGQRIG